MKAVLPRARSFISENIRVVEITAPEGMVINKEAHDVELTYAGQEVSVTETATSFGKRQAKSNGKS